MNKYYYGYVLNPNEVITDDFTEREKVGCVLIQKENQLRELFTDAKFMPVVEGQVIDGKKLFENNASLIGIIKKEINMEDVVNFTYKSEIDKKEYVNILIKLIYNTRKKAVDGLKEYYQMENTFKEEVNKNRI